MWVVRILDKNASRLVTAMQGLKDLSPFSTPPKGVFGRVAVVESGGVTINSEELDMEYTVKFDDNVESDEAEIIVYNLSKASIQALKWDNPITITAGYKGDTGVIFDGKIHKVTTKHDGVDKKSTIIAYAYIGGSKKKLANKTYKKGTKASYILKDLLTNYIDLPLAVFKIRRDHTYKEEVKIDSEVWEEIKKFAEVCGISAYVNNGKVYARHITEGDNIDFTVDEEHGLIGSPEEFKEEITAEDYKDTVTGYKLKMLLQHRMTTAAIIKLKSLDVSGQYRVRSGTHIFNDSEAVTEVEVV